ncbi:MAG: hypothetical protein K2L72_01175, partial [Clostridia bacterium]|nr:hypothetical protein [Clostridia bacterium]
MTGKKKFMITAFSVVGSLLIDLSSVLTAEAIIGKPLKVNPSRNLDGVDEDIRNALWYSSVAANSHNTQMWSVELYPDGNRLQISVDDARTLSAADPEKREAYISLGCYIETMSLAFSAYGYDVQVQCAGFTVNVAYSKRSNVAVDNSKLALIEKRHTDKSAFSNDRIKQDTANGLLGKYSALSLYQRGDENFTYIKQASMNAVTAQSANQAYRDELAEWLRFSDKEAVAKSDGLTADMLGLKSVVKAFYYWTTTRESAKGDKFARQGIDTAKKQLNNCGAFAVITGGNTFEELIEVGRTTQAFWFDCTQNNIAVQPFSAALETEPFCSSIQSDLAVDAPVQMILRLGYVDGYGANGGLRRNLSDYI